MKIYHYLLVLAALVFVGCAPTNSTSLKDPQAIFAAEMQKFDRYKPFHDAISKNSLPQLIAAFAADPIDINTQVHPRGDLLYIALRGIGQTQDKVQRDAIVEYLVDEKKANVNAKEPYGYTPLHSVTSVALAKYLIKHGANVNARTDVANTPLETTIWLQDPKLSEYLIQQGADVNAQDANGVNPFYTATLTGNTDMMKMLIKHGADIKARTKQSWTPILAAAYYGKIDAIKLLLENGADIKDRTSNQWTPLLVAAAQGQTDTVAFLLDHGATTDEKSVDGQMALYLAARYDRLDTVKLLVERGADIDSRNFNGMTPLHVAVMLGNNDVIRYLISEGANPNILDNLARTPLTLATQYRRRELIPVLKSAQSNYDLVSQEIQAKKRLKNMQKDVDAFIAKDDLDGLKNYADQYPEAVNFVPNVTLRLALTGPKGMKIGDIRKLVQSGKSEKLIISLINRSEVPYKEFTLEEIDVLSKMGISDTLISAMIDITTKLRNEAKAKEEQQSLLEEQKKIAAQKAETKIVYQNAPVQQQNNQPMDKLQNELIKQGVSKLLDNLFR